jgi:DNA recombination protein RmuC
MIQTLLILAFLAFAALAAGFAYAWWQASQRLLAVSDGGKAAIEQHVAALMKAQGEITGHVQGLSNRIDGFGKHIGQSMTDTTKSTHESLAKLGERLAIIDKAQQTITTLSGQVVELQHVLANKQTRGAFGQGRMEAIVRDGLPTNAYEFQYTLSNGTRPDCVIRLPRAPLLVVDAKFPLEAWNALRNAATPEATKSAEAQFRRDALKHIQDIADRYFIAGETQDVAIMFIPSESIFADFHERFEDMVQKAARARVMVVSPSMLMFALQLAMSMLRDQRMREQAGLIQQEVGKMMEDVTRLGERVKRLQTHFTQANGDIEDILKSTRGVFSHGTKIAQVEFSGDEEVVVTRVRPAPKPQAPRGPELPFEAAE